VSCRRPRRWRAPVALTVVLLLAGCQDDTDPGGDDPQASPDVVDDLDEVAAVEEAPVEELEPRLPLDVDGLELRTPAEGVGPFPTLVWESVPDAHRYHVSVIDGDGRALWAWTTSDTEVVLGGFDEPPPEHVRGPRLHAPMHWHVLARDADERVIAQSGLRPIAP
jgi:hypothetical protein